MAFGATLTITVNAVAKVLNKVKEQDYGSEYKLIEATGEYLVKIQHSTEKATAAGTVYDRHFVDFKHTVYGVSPAPDIVREAYLWCATLAVTGSSTLAISWRGPSTSSTSPSSRPIFWAGCRNHSDSDNSLGPTYSLVGLG